VTQPANGNCARCNIILPTAATQELCDECTDTPALKIREPETTRPMRVVHAGRDETGIAYYPYHPLRKGRHE
jgi:hypothetical protein